MILTHKTEGTAYTEAGKLWGVYVKPWIFLYAYLYRVRGDNLVQLQSFAKAQLSDYNVHIRFFGVIGYGEILRCLNRRTIRATHALGKFDMAMPREYDQCKK